MKQPFLRNVGLALATCVSLTACGSSEGTSADPEVNKDIVHSVEVTDGRYYDCFASTKYKVGGIDCERIRFGESETPPLPNHNPEVAISIEVVDGREFDCFANTTYNVGGLACSVAK